MAQFILLLHETPSDFGELSPEEMQGLIARYSAWREKLGAEGKITAGHKLTDEGGRQLRGSGPHLRVVDGPYSEAKEVIGGLFVVEAEDYDDAVAIASTCPHLENGWIELRQIDPV